MDTWKKFAIIITVVVILVVPLTLLAINYNGWGAQLSTSLTPFTTGIQKVGQVIPTAMLENGYVMLIGYLAIPLLMFGFAVIYWNRDWGYKITGASATTNSASNYDNTMKREPEEPERASITK